MPATGQAMTNFQQLDAYWRASPSPTSSGSRTFPMSASAGSAIRGGHLRADGQRHREGHRVFSNEESHRIAHGADEIDLVNSGLEETMITAYRQVREQRMRDSGSQICARRRFS